MVFGGMVLGARSSTWSIHAAHVDRSSAAANPVSCELRLSVLEDSKIYTSFWKCGTNIEENKNFWTCDMNI